MFPLYDVYMRTSDHVGVSTLFVFVGRRKMSQVSRTGELVKLFPHASLREGRAFFFRVREARQYPWTGAGVLRRSISSPSYIRLR